MLRQGTVPEATKGLRRWSRTAHISRGLQPQLRAPPSLDAAPPASHHMVRSPARPSWRASVGACFYRLLGVIYVFAVDAVKSAIRKRNRDATANGL